MERRGLIVLTVLLSLLLIGALIAVIVLAVNNSQNSSSSSSTECTTTTCYTLSEQILNSIDDSVDPCEDFFQYSCGGFIKEYSYELADNSQWSNFDILSDSEMNTFLDAILNDVNQTLINHTAIQKAATFYQSCYYASVSQETVQENSALQDLVRKVNFSDGNSAWDTKSTSGFQQAISWLSLRGWNYLFAFSVLDTYAPLIYQNYPEMEVYNSTELSALMNSTFVPLFESLFGLSSTQAQQIGNKVVAFISSLHSIETYSSNPVYSDTTLLYNTLTNASDFSILGSSSVMNYTKVLLDTFDCKLSDVANLYYFTPDLSYFKNLSLLIESTTPDVIQYFLFTDVLLYGLNYESSLEQSGYITRSYYCFSQVLSEFPFVYGYILDKYMYSNPKYQTAYEMVTYVKEKGLRALMEDVTWMDSISRNNSLTKVAYLGIYVGFPPRIDDYNSLDIYYQNVTNVTMSNGYVNNYFEMLEFNAYVTHATFDGSIYNMVYSWPSFFASSSDFGSWLTGINAFYVPYENFFTIPVTITQHPFFDNGYPSAINFGGLGTVIGHEMSHGFDPDGSYYNYAGQYQDIWTNETRAVYDEKITCYINQYNSFEIEPGVYVNGNNTITENVADNSGIVSSYTAWQVWKQDHDDSYTLPGVSLTEDQLFWFAWANAWCQVYTNTYYSDWTDVHSPNPARVWGVAQNNDAFAQAYNCKTGSKMNPSHKCTLW